MPLFSLHYRAGSMEGATLVAPLTAGPKAFALRLLLKCCACNEAQARTSVLAEPWGGDDAKVDIPGSKGRAALVQKCCACGSVFSLDVVTPGAAVEPFTAALAERVGGPGAVLCSLECRGCEPVAFEPGAGWRVEGEGGTVWCDVDLNRDDFAEYDEAGEGVAVTVGAVSCVFTAGGAGGKKK